MSETKGLCKSELIGWGEIYPPFIAYVSIYKTLTFTTN